MDKSPGNITGTVTIWAERFWNAEKGIHYSRSLKQHLGKLTVSLLVYSTGRNPEQIRRSVESGDLEAPSVIQACVKAGDDDIPPTRSRSEFRSLFRSWTRKRGVSPLKKDAENVVKFLEELIEVKHDR